MSCSRCGRSNVLRNTTSPSVIGRPGGNNSGFASNRPFSNNTGYQPTFTGNSSVSDAIMGLRYVPRQKR